MNEQPRSQRHVLVTGAASGIGAAVCRRFAEDRIRITAVDLQADRLRALSEELGSFDGSHVSAICGDLADDKFAGAVVANAWNKDGPIDAAILAAGIYPAIAFLELTPAAWDRVQHVNVRAVMQLTQSLAAHAIASKRHATVVAISSGAAQRARPGAAHYSASKAALEMLVRSAALELGPLGIRVNAVSPGFVAVQSDVNPVTSEYADALSKNPLGRPGTPRDIAAAVHWLASDEANWVTGSVLRVDGGASAGSSGLPLHWSGTTPVQDPRSRGER